jgi:hypothetical protein
MGFTLQSISHRTGSRAPLNADASLVVSTTKLFSALAWEKDASIRLHRLAEKHLVCRLQRFIPLQQAGYNCADISLQSHTD